MKLLVQSDDFGITEGCAQGAVKAIRDGIVRNTGLFANMPWAAECVALIRPYLDRIAFGLDLNLSTGGPVLPAEQIPGLVQPNGVFLTSSMNRALDTPENGRDHLNYDEVYREFEAQIQRYIALVGKKPDYLHGHAYGTATTQKASMDLAAKYEIPFSSAVMRMPGVHAPRMDWYIYPSTYENQLNSSLKNFLLEDRGNLLGAEYGFLVSHCGYVDSTLMGLSSFNLCRMKDLEALTSPEVLEWVKDNKVELITYNDLVAELGGKKAAGGNG